LLSRLLRMSKRDREEFNGQASELKRMIVVLADRSGREVVITLPEGADFSTLRLEASKAFGIANEKTVHLDYAGEPIRPDLPLSAQMADGCTLSLSVRRFHLSDIPPNVTPDDLLKLCGEHDHLLTQISSADPELGAALATRELLKVRTLMMMRAMRQHKSIFAKEQERRELWKDPDNPDNQRKIAEMIQQEAINASHEMAMNENPEAFAQVFMLYVPLEVQGVSLKAFVDSGAQITIMSPQCAERCGILRLMDKRYQGMASGVGTARILGKIHMVQMKLGNSYFPISVTVLENASMDILFGLDTLKRYRCCIDLKKGVLRMEDGSQGPEEVAFLSEGEIPLSEKTGGGGGGGGEEGVSDAVKEASLPLPASSSSSAPAPAASVPAPAASSSSSSSTSASSAPPASSSASATQLLVSMGFSEPEAQAALQATHGNVDEAAALLLASR
jgi:DNA damage-inducible protein 1